MEKNINGFKVYPKPEIGSTVKVKVGDITHTCTKLDRDINDVFYPDLSGKAEGWPKGTELEVCRIVHFHGGAWKALCKTNDGRFRYMADWELEEIG